MRAHLLAVQVERLQAVAAAQPLSKGPLSHAEVSQLQPPQLPQQRQGLKVPTGLAVTVDRQRMQLRELACVQAVCVRMTGQQ
jgi:hypothetical protein